MSLIDLPMDVFTVIELSAQDWVALKMTNTHFLQHLPKYEFFYYDGDIKLTREQYIEKYKTNIETNT